MEESDKPKLLSKIILISLVIIMGWGLLMEPRHRPYNAFRGVFVSSQHLDSVGSVGSQIRGNSIQSINSPLFVQSHTLGSIMEEDIDKWDIIVDKIIQCESQNQMVWGDLHLPIKAYGVAQFQFRTFEWLKELANAPRLNFYKEKDQVWLLKWALQNNYGYLWSCYNKI